MPGIWSRAWASQQVIQTLRNRYLQLIIQLVGSFHKNDNYLFEHAGRVAALAVESGNALHLGEESLENLEIAAWLHDLGPLGWQRAVEGFSEEQWGRLQLHPVVTSQVLQRLPDLAPVKKILSHLREHFDGSGTPGDLAGPDIPVESQLLAVCEYFDHLAWPRPGSRPIALTQVEGVVGCRWICLVRCAGFGAMWWVREQVADPDWSECCTTSSGHPHPSGFPLSGAILRGESGVWGIRTPILPFAERVLFHCGIPPQVLG